jgi:hypothetical protein
MLENFDRREFIGEGTLWGDEVRILMDAETSAKLIFYWPIIHRSCAGMRFV